MVRCDSDAVPLLAVNDLLWFVYLYPLRVLSAFDPRILIHPIGRLAQPLVQFRSRGRRETVMHRMLAAQGAGVTRYEAPRISREFIANSTFRMLDDLALTRRGFATKVRCSGIEGIEHLERAKVAGKGVIVLTAHFCAGRVAKRYLAALGYPMLSVRDQLAKGVWRGRLGRILESRRMELLQTLIGESVYVHDPGCTLKILRRLRCGGLVHVNFDGQSGTNTALWPFFGVPRRFSTGIFDLVRLSGCAVVPMLCLGRSTNLRIIFSPGLDVVKVPGREEFIRANLPTFVGTIEKQIRDHPGEWEQWPSF